MASKATEIWTHVTGSPPPQAAPWRVGDWAEFFCASNQYWMLVHVIEVDPAQGIQINAKEGQWLTENELLGKMRRFKAQFSVGDAMQYDSVTHGKWIDCRIVEVDPTFGIQIDAKRGEWMTGATLTGRFRYPDGQPVGGCRVTVPVLLQHADYLETEFPALLESLAEVVERFCYQGFVLWENFLDLYVGNFVSTKYSRPWIKKKKEYRLSDLQRIWKVLGKDDIEEITFDKIIENKELVNEEIPELVECWSKIDLNSSGKISWQEFRVYFGYVEVWLEAELNKILGKDRLKKQIRDFYDYLLSIREDSADCLQILKNFVFRGNPGTGKKTMGRLMAQLMNRIGLKASDGFKEVHVSELIAENAEQTIKKTLKVADETKEGVLFINEAWKLMGGPGDEGECLLVACETLHTLYEESPLIIFAGCYEPMYAWLEVQTGYCKRIWEFFNFDEQSDSAGGGATGGYA